MDRIIGLPRIADIPPDLVKKFSELLLLPSATWTILNQTQIASLISYKKFNGLLGAIGVGLGKTCVSFKIADFAYAKGLRKIILLVPANCVDKTVQELPDLKKEIAVNLPVHCLGGQPKQKRLKLSRETSGLFVMSYSQLSLKDTDELLSNISPECIIADEAHNLANLTSSCTKRVKRYMDEFPETEFCAMSGTLTAKGLHDYAHLCHWALKSNSPLPLVWADVDKWGYCIDTTFSSHVFGNEMKPLLEWARKNYPNQEFDEEEVASLRRAYKLRLETAPGSITSGDATVSASLLIENVPVKDPEGCPGWDKLQEYIRQVDNYSMAPNGDEIQYPIHKFRYNYELSVGLYLELYWPEPEVIADRREIPLHVAEEYLHKSKEHLTAHQMYSSELRTWLEENSISGLDSPMLVGLEMHHHGANRVGDELYTKWRFMKSKEFDEIVERDSRAHRICDYKIKAAVLHAKKVKKSCIYWVYHQEVGRWLYEEMLKSGLDVLYAPSGKTGSKIILDKTNGDKFIVASISAFGTGQNLQRFRYAYFVQPSRSATQMEQALGRLHRQGYPHDQCIQFTNLTTQFDKMMFSATMADSLYIHQTQTNQKLIYADYNPVPENFSRQVLKERGLILNESLEESYV
jgi:hypothetical protein